MELYKALRPPKMDWYGDAFRWYCEECCRAGEWSTRRTEAVKQGHQHARDKHGADVVEWKEIS